MKHKLNAAFVTVAEAAVIIGVTPQAVHKRIRLGTIESLLTASGKRILKRDGLERRWWGSTQRIADMPDRGQQAISWAGVADRLNGYLAPGWPAPPWDGDQVNTLSVLLELAHE